MWEIAFETRRVCKFRKLFFGEFSAGSPLTSEVVHPIAHLVPEWLSSGRSSLSWAVRMGRRTFFLQACRPIKQMTDFTANDLEYPYRVNCCEPFPMPLTVTLNKLTLWAFKSFRPFRDPFPSLTWKAPHKIKLQSKQIDTKRRSWVDEVEPPIVGAPSKSPIIRNAIFVSPAVILR